MVDGRIHKESSCHRLAASELFNNLSVSSPHSDTVTPQAATVTRRGNAGPAAGLAGRVPAGSGTRQGPMFIPLFSSFRTIFKRTQAPTSKMSAADNTINGKLALITGASGG